MSQSQRNGSIDILRLLGAFGIILFHCGAPYASIGLAALPMFVMLLIYFGANAPLGTGAKRLLKIWVIWSAIYALLKIAQSTVSGTVLEAEFEPWMVWTGPSIHLWFLPFCVLFLGLNAVALRHLPDAALIALACALSIACLLAARNTFPIPLAQWVTVIPAAFTGLIMARLRSPALAAFLLALLAGIAWLTGFTASSDQLAIAGLATAIAVHVRTQGTALTSSFGPLSLGLYLIHPAIIAISLHAFEAGTFTLFAAVSAVSLATCITALKLAPITIGQARREIP
ncbi:MAG: acyltransferase family protein [Pseudomonadota bacterium]